MGAEARTRLTIWFVVASAILSFGQAIEGQGYLGPALLGTLLASGAVAGTRRLGGGAFLAAAGALAALIWYVALIFRAPLTAWSLPTPAALLEVGAALARAYSHSLVDYAPVPLREGYAIMIVGISWVAAVAAELTTFRWKRPLLAVILPGVMFSFAMLVGTGEGSPVLVVLFLAALFAFWASESGHRVRAWGSMMDPGASSGALARRIGGGCLAAAFVAPLFLPAIGDGIVSWRTGSGGGPGGGDGTAGASLSPWVSIVPRLITQSDQEMFRVQADEPAYWRTASLELFDGLGWREANTGNLPASDGTILGERDVPSPDGNQIAFVQELTVTGLRGTALPAALTPAHAVKMTDSGPDARGVHYDPQSAAVQIAGGLAEDEVYRTTSRVVRPTFEELDQAIPPPGGFELASAYRGGPIRQARTGPGDLGQVEEVELPEIYYQLPAILAPEVVDLTRRWTRDEETPLRKLVEIQRRLRAFDYTLNPDQTRDHDYLRRFLVDTRAGYCQQFATAFAVMARILDYPARVSVGFLPGSQDLATGAFTVTGTEAHAWPEVFFEGFGWIPFEPTPREAYATPAHTAPSPDGPGAFAGDGADRSSDRISVDPGRAAFGREGLTPDGRPLADLAVRSDTEQAESTAWQSYFRGLATTLTLVLGVLALATPLAKEARDRRRYVPSRDERLWAEAAFIELQRHGSELVGPRRPYESARAYLQRLTETGRVDPVVAARLATIYESAVYSSSAPPTGIGSEARDLVKKVRSQLWSGASWWARGAHVFSPRSLRV